MVAMASPQPKQRTIGPQPGPQTEFLRTPADICIFGGAAGGGKRLHVDTPIATPDGWSTMGQLLVGDIVFDENGKQCNVVWISPIELAPKSYRVTFSDGTVLLADADHQWFTRTVRERDQRRSLSEESRSKRRASRPSRGTGKRSYVAVMNSARKYTYKTAPDGGIRTTADILETLTVGINGRLNHSIDVNKPLELPDAELPIHPYLLGYWLGDGTTTTGQVTIGNADRDESIRALEATGATVIPIKSCDLAFRIEGLTRLLRTNNLLGSKRIPQEYLRASVSQRLELLQGLMDTDGYCDSRGQCEFTTTKPTIRDGVLELLASLGIKAAAMQGEAKLNGRVIGPKWRIKFLSELPCFKLARKANLQKRDGFRGTHSLRYITSVERIDPVPMRCIQVDSPSHLYLAGKSMVPTHNSFALLLDQLRWCNIAGFSGIIFRRTRPQLLGGGGIWENANEIYRQFGARFRSGSPMDAKFPGGAKVAFSHLQLEKDKYEHQGQQYAVIGFDELTHFTETQFWYLVSRNRSGCGVEPYIRGTCNPDSASWVAGFIAWWIDQKTGIAIPERSGVLRWMLRDPITSSIRWFDSEAEALEEAGDGESPLSVTFILSTLDDNPALLAADPGYRAKLQAMSRVDRERLLGGNWKISNTDGAEWPGDYFMDIDCEEWPEHFELSVIAVDASEGVTAGDYGAIVFAGLWQGKIYIDADIERRPIPELIEYTALLAIEHRPTEVTWEGNQFQKYLVGDYDRYVQDNHLFPVPTGYILNYKVKKTLRIKRLGGYLRKNQLKFRTNRPGVVLLLNQLRGFPIADHDDGPDALEMAIRRLCELAANMFDGTEYGHAGGEEYSTSYEAAEVYQ